MMTSDDDATVTPRPEPRNGRRLPRAAILLMAVVALLLPATASAQPQPPPPTEGGAVQAPAVAGDGDGAPERADAAVEAWLDQAPLSIGQLASLDTEELCREIPALLSTVAPPPGTEVRLDGRVEREAADPDLRVFTYAAVRPGDQLDVVEVRLRRQADASAPGGEEWAVEFVGFRSTLELTGVRAWLQTPIAWYLFSAFTLLVAFLLFNRGSFLRRWLAQGWQVIRQHRRLVIGTQVALYSLFGLGALLGSTLPAACEQAVVDLVTTAVTSLGATDAYGSGNIARAAATTFYQNFMVVTLSVTFSLAALFGIPAYLFAAFSFFTQGIPFGLLGGAGGLELLFIIVLLVLELTSYFLVVAGGGMVLATLFGQEGEGESKWVRAYRKLLLMLPIAMLLLLVGAWYESVILIAGG